MTALRPQVYVIGLAALALAACAPSTGATTAQAPTVAPVMSMSTATPPPAPPATTVTVTAPPPVTVTAAPPTVATTPVGQHIASDEPFQSPSGNIQCAMFTYGAGGHTVRCEVADHHWVATQPDGCHMNWGDRVAMEEGSPAEFGCYGQEMPTPTHTLAYGQIQTLGSLRCESETVGITCTDTNTSHYFSVSRDAVHLG